jgi:hypothetical protein
MPTKTLLFGVSQDILSKVPRYFGSQQAMLRELFQNSWRAGARNLVITYLENVLRFEDDGSGSDAESFLIAGQSGWSKESEAVDPAGLGAFSYLRPEYVFKVTYRSRDWRMTISPSDLEVGHVDVEDGLDVVHGMQVKLTLTDQVKFSEGNVRSARAEYPMRVIFHTAEEQAKEIMPVEILSKVQGRVSVPHAGWVEIGKREGYLRDFEAYAIWQHASFGSGALSEALTQAVYALKYEREKDLARSIFHAYALVLHIDPTSGIRPKLPDREELISDDHLRVAGHRIVRAILDEYCLGFDLNAVKGLPDVIKDESIYASTVKDKTLLASQMLRSCAKKEDSLTANILAEDANICKATFGLFGYRHVAWEDPSQVGVLTQDDGDGDYPTLDSFFHDTKLYVRRKPVLEISDEGLRTALCAQGLYAVRPDQDINHNDKAAPQIRVSGLRYHKADWLAFADELLVNGKPVQWIARSNPNTSWNCVELDRIDREMAGQDTPQFEEEEVLVLVVAIPPVRFLSELDQQYPTWRGYIAWLFDNEGVLDRLTAFEAGSYEFDNTLIETNLKQAAIRWLDGKLVAVLERQLAIKAALEDLRRAKHNIYLRISPTRKELRPKAAVALANGAIRFAIYVLQSRSEAIDRQFKETVKRSL